MRQLLIEVPSGQADDIMALAESLQARNMLKLQAAGPDLARELVIIHLPNKRLEELLNALKQIPRARVNFFPSGVVPLQPVLDDLSSQVTTVQPKSPVEIFLSTLQSIGSWSGFLSYALASAVVVWAGMFTNTSYLLVAAMLLSPLAGPAMTFAIGTSYGDWRLIVKAMTRYASGLGVIILVAALLSIAFRLKAPTLQMIDTSRLSMTSVVLPLAAGAAGAMNLMQAERNSLVSGAAVGMLVAASLTPPAGLAGMAATLGRWDMVGIGLFQLALQFVAINLAGALLFRIFAGMSPQKAFFRKGLNRVFVGSIMVTALLLVVLVGMQVSNPPSLQEASRSKAVVAEIQQLLNRHPWVYMVEADVHFTQADIPGQNTLLGVVYVQRKPQATMSDERLASALRRQIQQRLLQQGFNITPLIDVQILEPP